MKALGKLGCFQCTLSDDVERELVRHIQCYQGFETTMWEIYSHPFLFRLSLPLPPVIAFLQFLPFPCLPPALSSPSLSLEVRPLKSTRRSGGPLWAPPAGSGTESQPKSNFVHFSLKIWHLMATSEWVSSFLTATILTTFLRNAVLVSTATRHWWDFTNVAGELEMAP